MYKRIMFAAAMLGLGFSSIAQPGKVEIFDHDFDHNHYSIETVPDGEIIAGTFFTGDALNPTDINVFKVDANGAIQWEKTFDFAPDERCFDVEILEEGFIGLTGYVVEDDAQRILVMKLDDNGTIVKHKIINQGIEGQLDQAGYCMTYTNHEAQNEVAYFVGGNGTADARIDRNLVKEANNQGVVVKLDADLNVVKSIVLETGEESPYAWNMRTSVSDITEISELGIFVTGSTNNRSSGVSQSVLLMMYDFDLNVRWMRTSISTSDINRGVDAVYFKESDELYVMSLGSQPGYIYQPTELYRITDVGTLSPIASHLGNISTTTEGMTLMGLSMEKTEEDQIAIAGFSYNMNVNGTVTSNTPSFIMLFDPVSKGLSNAVFYPTSNFQWREEDGGFLSNTWGFHSSATPDIFALNVNAQENKVLGYSRAPSAHYYDLNLFTSGIDGIASEDCSVAMEVSLTEAEPRIPMFVNYEVNYQTSFDLSPDTDEEKHEVDESCAPLGSGCFVEVDIRRWSTNCYSWDFVADLNFPAGATVLSYAWDFGDGTTSTVVAPSHSYQHQCTITVCLTVTIQTTLGTVCSETYCESFAPKGHATGGVHCSPCNGIIVPKNGENMTTKSTWSVFPNPASTSFTIQHESDVEGAASLVIMDMNGRTLMQLTNSQATAGSSVDVSNLAPGIYVLSGTLGQTTVREQIVVK